MNVRSAMLSLCAYAMIACSPRTQTAGRYEKHGISFSVPRGWSVSSDETGPEARDILVEGGQGMVILLCLPPTSAKTLPGFATEWMQRHRAKIAEIATRVAPDRPPVPPISFGTPETINDEVAGQAREGVLLPFILNIYGDEEEAHAERLYVVPGGTYTVFIVWDAPESEPSAVREGAQSLLRSLQIGTQ